MRQRSGPGPSAAVLGAAPLGDLASRHVVMAPAEASGIARRWWDLDVADAVRLDTEKDDTFRLQTTSGERYVLKLSNPTEDPAGLAFECGLMQHVHASEHAVPVPRLLASTQGGVLVAVRDDAGQERLARLMSFMEGTRLDATHSSAVERERLGEVLARLRLAAAGYAHPADRRRCAWDLTHLPSLQPLVELLDEDEQTKRVLRKGFERYMDHAAPHVASLRRQVLHNDLSRSNVLVDHDDPKFVTGVIDFGDAVRTAIAIDVSTALVNQLPRDAAEHAVDDLFADGRDLLRGYLRHADLTQEELALVPHLVMGRVVVRAVITLYRAAEMPANRRYILRNTEQGWAQLAWFLDRSPAEVASTLI